MYHLLGNDVEDDSIPAPVATREVVKNTGSSKKADVAPAKADPARAKTNKSKPSGNEGALKTKVNNKSISGPSSTPSKHSKKSFDRHSKTGKTDSAKKLKQGWGSDDKREVDESAAQEDADEEAAEEASEVDVSPEQQKKSLQDYFAELELKKQEFSAAKPTRTVAPIDGEVIEKEQETFVQSTQAKKFKSKVQKEKKFLDIDAKFADDAPAQTERTFNSRKPTRGRGGKPTTSTRKPAAATAKKPVVNDKNFPSL